MSDRKSDVRNVLSTMGKLFFGTDKEHSETISKIAKDAAGTVRRVRRREGAINAIGEHVEEDRDESPPASRGDRAERRR